MRIKTAFFLIFTIASAILFSGCAINGKPKENIEEQKGDIYLQAGTEALLNENTTEALAALIQATKLLPNSASAWNNLGLAYYAKKEPEKAKQAWEKALAIDPSFSDARNNIGAFYLEKRSYTKAEQEFKVVLKDLLYTNAHQTHYNLAIVYLREGKNLLAEQHLRLAVKEKENYCPAWQSLAKLEKEKGNYLQALESLKAATSGICYANPGAHFEIAALYLMAHDKRSAKIKFLEIIEHFPSSLWARKAEANLQLINNTGKQ